MSVGGRLRRVRSATRILAAPARAAAGSRVVAEALEGRQFFSGTAAPAPAVAGGGSAVLAAATLVRPRVSSTNPEGGATNVRRDTFVSADVLIPNGGIRLDTMVSANVYLTRDADGARIKSVLNTSGGGDVIVLRPEERLASNTGYTFHVTAGLKDVAGESFVPFELAFTTGTATGSSSSAVKFDKRALPTTDGRAYTSLAIGPDRRLYAATFDGDILRWRIKGDGTLSDKEVFDVVRERNGGKRSIAGILFDPASTPDKPILWVSHSAYGLTDAADWAGKISVLSDDGDGDGGDLEDYRDRVVGLPRAARDHLTNQLTWGPDGALYFNQGSTSAMGAADAAWGNRKEHLLSGAILRVDVAKLPAARALDVKTEAGGTYKPAAAGAAVTIYATGVRNAYNILWHSNGSLYAPTNGSAAGGNTPEDDDHDVPGLTGVDKSQHDFLFRIEQGGYYGHPNPVRGEYVMNGGNPTKGKDPAEVDQYPVGTKPDANYRGFAFDFGNHISPNGAIEYTSGKAFGGALVGKILVARYSGPDDIIALSVGADGDVTGDQTGIEGFTGFNNPVDLIEDPTTGNVYVAEFGPEDSSDEPGGRKITLLKPELPPATRVRFTSADVDARDPGGTTTVAEGKSYDVTAGGWNVGGQHDGFRYLYEERSGDFDVVVRLDALDGASPIAKAGLMARDSLAAGARNVFSAASLLDGYRFSTRAVAGGTTTISKSDEPAAFPNCYLRLSRVGNTFTGYYAADGVTWEATGRQTLAMPQKVFFGLATTSGGATQGDVATAKFRGLADYKTAAAALGDADWASAAAAPADRGDAAVATVGGNVYLFGGYTDDGLTRTRRVDVYDEAADRWTADAAQLPVATGHMAAAADGRDVYLAGGTIGDAGGGADATSFTTTDAVWRFNVDDLTFTPMPSLPRPAALGGFARLGRTLHYFGGSGENGLGQRGDHYVLNLDAPAAGWTTAAELPAARKRMAVAEAGGRIYAIGGHVGDFGRRAFVTTVQSYDPATDQWTQRAPLPEGRSHFHNAAVVLNGAVVVAGGKSDDEAALGDVLIYDPLANRWRDAGGLPEGRNSGVLAAVNGVLVYTTGSSGGGAFQTDTFRGEFDTD